MDSSQIIFIALVVLAIVVVMSIVKAVPQGMEYTVEQFAVSYTHLTLPTILHV